MHFESGFKYLATFEGEIPAKKQKWAKIIMFATLQSFAIRTVQFSTVQKTVQKFNTF